MPSKPSNRRKARHLLVQALYQWKMTGADVGSIEAEFFSDRKMTDVDTEYFRDLLHAVPGNVAELDERYGRFLDRAMEGLDPVSLSVLRLGTYELMFRIDIPYRVAINEAVNLARAFGPTDAHKYINSILDKVAATCRQTEIRAARQG